LSLSKGAAAGAKRKFPSASDDGEYEDEEEESDRKERPAKRKNNEGDSGDSTATASTPLLADHSGALASSLASIQQASLQVQERRQRYKAEVAAALARQEEAAKKHAAAQQRYDEQLKALQRMQGSEGATLKDLQRAEQAAEEAQLWCNKYESSFGYHQLRANKQQAQSILLEAESDFNSFNSEFPNLPATSTSSFINALKDSYDKLQKNVVEAKKNHDAIAAELEAAEEGLVGPRKQKEEKDQAVAKCKNDLENLRESIRDGSAALEARKEELKKAEAELVEAASAHSELAAVQGGGAARA
jgi:chromosome segregation ATPase